MAIRGDLLSVDLSNVFQMLAMNRKRGVLRVQNRENILEKRALVLDSEGVALLEIPATRDLSALLVDQGAIDHAVYAETRVKARQFGVDPMTFLRKRATIDDETIEAAKRRLHEEMILEIFLWKNVTFSLDEENLPEADEARRFFNLDILVMEAARRQDEWVRVIDLIGGGRDIWRPAEGPRDEVGDIEMIVLDHLDGIRDTQQIMAETGLPRYHVDLAIGRLHELGLVQKHDLEDLIDSGDILLDKGQIEDAIRLYKCAVRYDRRSIALHKRLAHAFMKQGRVAKAAAHYKFCAMTLLENDLVRESLAIYEYVVQLLPTDFKALEQVLALLARLEEPLTEDDEDCLELGLKLCHFYYESKRFADAERVLRHLMDIAPEDTGLGFILARIQSKTGRIADAVETYMKLAGRLHDQGDLQGALNAYKLVVSFDTASKQICLQRIDHIHDILSRKRRRRRMGAAAFTFIAVLSASALSYFWYHNRAESEFETVLSAEQSVVTEDAWQAIAERYRDFQGRFPFTLASRRATERVSRAEYKISEFRDSARVAQEREQQRQRESIERAEREMIRGESQLELRDLEAALGFYRSALRIAHESGQGNWADQTPREIPSRIAEIEAHLEGERQRLAAIDSALRDGDRARAFAVARTMVRPPSDPLDPGDVEVVSRQTMAKIRVPIDLSAWPSTAIIRDETGREWSGRSELELSQLRRRSSLDITLEGYRPSHVEFDWQETAFENHVVLELRESSSLALGERVLALSRIGDALAVLCGNGSIHLIEAGRASRRLAPNGFRTPSTEPVVFAGRIAYGTSDGRVLVFDRESKATSEVWSVHTSIDAIGAIQVVGNLLAVATDDGRPRLRYFATADGAEKGGIDLPSPVTALVVQGRRLVARLADGSIAFVDPTASKPEEIRPGDYVGRPLVFAQGVWVADADERLRRVDDSGFGLTVSDQKLAEGAEPRIIGNELVALLESGRLLVVDQGGKSRLLRALPSTFVRHATGRVEDGGAGQVLVELDDSRLLVVSLTSGDVVECYRSANGAPARSIIWRDRLVLGCADDEGTIETYRR